MQTLVPICHRHGWWGKRIKTGQEGQVRFNSWALYLSWEIHSKSFTLVTFSSISFAATSLAWTSITMRADITARCILDSWPRTTATKSASWVRKRKWNNPYPNNPGVLTQCNQPYCPLSTDHRLCLSSFCLFLVRDENDCSGSKCCSGLPQSWLAMEVQRITEHPPKLEWNPKGHHVQFLTPHRTIQNSNLIFPKCSLNSSSVGLWPLPLGDCSMPTSLW